MGLLSFLRRFAPKESPPNPWTSAPNPDDPLFRVISKEDPDFDAAYRGALATIPQFITHVREGGGFSCLTKLRFRDPEASEELGEDRFMFLWLTNTQYHADKHHFSAEFFEVPPVLLKWHHIGQQLLFEADDIWDWMALREGHLHGGFTLRVTRSQLPEEQRESYDRYVGVSVYESLPSLGQTAS
jgi:uncharacterized protein YegJ (DUF2314 family)